MQLLDEVRSSWGWVGIEPVELLSDNDFGNLILKDAQGQYWRLCPEDLYCEVVASSRKELTISLEELIRASGHIARQIADLPDGASITLTVTD